MEVDCQDGELAWFSSLVGFFSPPSYFIADVQNGEIDGKLSVGFYSNGSINQINASFGIRDFHAINGR